jgi:hypothetical protein
MLTREDYKLILSTTKDDLLVAYMMLMEAEVFKQEPRFRSGAFRMCKRMPTKQLELVEILRLILVFTEFTKDTLEYIGFDNECIEAAGCLGDADSRVSFDSKMKEIKGNLLSSKVFISERLGSLENKTDTKESIVNAIIELVNS